MSGAKKTDREVEIPVFDPRPSAAFAVKLLTSAHIPFVLGGRLAVWAWVRDPAEHRFTKDVDVFVPPGFAAAAVLQLRKERFAGEILNLQIGGISAQWKNLKDKTQSIKIDFIERTNPEWGDIGSLVKEAILEADEALRTVKIGSTTLPLVSIDYLILFKLVSGREKDDDDIVDLLRQSEVNVDFLRTKLKTEPTLQSCRSRFEDFLRRTHHAKAKRTYNEGF